MANSGSVLGILLKMIQARLTVDLVVLTYKGKGSNDEIMNIYFFNYTVFNPCLILISDIYCRRSFDVIDALQFSQPSPQTHQSYALILK